MSKENALELLIKSAEAAVAYDLAIQGCADDPDKMSSYCTAQGDDLDTLYFNWQQAARAGLEAIKVSSATTNKAAEESEQVAWMIEQESDGKRIYVSCNKAQAEDWLQYDLDRKIVPLVRQVANKAEVEDCPECKGKGERRISCIWPSHCPDCDGTGKVATPPATTGASTGPRPTDDDLWDATLRDRDAYHEWADKLADAIAKHFGVDIGEHSNQNLPWDEALQAIENAEPVGASTVLTDERIDELWLNLNWKPVLEGKNPEDYNRALRIALCHEVARDVAAQAGQVAVPEDVLRVVRRLLDGSQPQDVPGALMVIDTALAGGAA